MTFFQCPSRLDFFRDMELIYNNSKDFNGEQSEYTLKAKKLLDIVTEKLYIQFNDPICELEKKIHEIQEKAIEIAELDSLGTSLGELDESSNTGMYRVSHIEMIFS